MCAEADSAADLATTEVVESKSAGQMLGVFEVITDDVWTHHDISVLATTFHSTPTTSETNVSATQITHN